MNKVPASSLQAEVKELLVKMSRLVQIQKTNPVESEQWQAASDALRPLWVQMQKVNAPHPDHIDWAS